MIGREKNPHNWLKIIKENSENPYEYGFEEQNMKEKHT